MDVGVEFQPNFELSIWQIILTVCLGLLLATWFAYVFWITRKIKPRSLANLQPKPYIPPDISAIKQKYIQLIDQVSSSYSYQQISDKQAHQSLSSLSRLFVYEIKGHRVDTFTLADLKKSRYIALVPIIEKTYAPAFSESLVGDVAQVCNSAKEVILAWD